MLQFNAVIVLRKICDAGEIESAIQIIKSALEPQGFEVFVDTTYGMGTEEGETKNCVIIGFTPSP